MYFSSPITTHIINCTWSVKYPYSILRPVYVSPKWTTLNKVNIYMLLYMLRELITYCILGRNSATLDTNTHSDVAEY